MYLIPIFTEVDVFEFDFTTAVFLDEKKVYLKVAGCTTACAEKYLPLFENAGFLQ